MCGRNGCGGQIPPAGGAANAAGGQTGPRQSHSPPQNKLRRYTQIFTHYLLGRIDAFEVDFSTQNSERFVHIEGTYTLLLIY